jgi:hypothetical protein
MKNFLITGFGRSGTKFLSTLMNKSKIWKVAHEPNGGVVTKDNLLRFNDDYYGEVNSMMRHHFNNITVGKKGVIIRNPKDIYMSLLNRNKNDLEIFKTLDELNKYYKLFLEWVESDDIVRIDFDKMVRDVNYLTSILEEFGITDVPITTDIINKKVNINKVIKYKSFDTLPTKYKDAFNKLNW